MLANRFHQLLTTSFKFVERNTGHKLMRFQQMWMCEWCRLTKCCAIFLKTFEILCRKRFSPSFGHRKVSRWPGVIWEWMNELEKWETDFDHRNSIHFRSMYAHSKSPEPLRMKFWTPKYRKNIATFLIARLLFGYEMSQRLVDMLCSDFDSSPLSSILVAAVFEYQKKKKNNNIGQQSVLFCCKCIWFVRHTKIFCIIINLL